MDRKSIAPLLIVPISLVLVIILLLQISFSDIVNALLSISPLYLLSSFVLYVALYVTRAARFRIMLKNVAGYGTIFNIVCLHNLANSVMPFKTGELAFVYLSKVKLNVSAGIGLATVTIARMFDALAVCALFILAQVMTPDSMGILHEAEPVILALATVLLILIISVIWFGGQILKLTRRLSSTKLLVGLPLSYVQSKLEEIVAYYSSMESKGSVLRLFTLSVVIWILNPLAICTLALSMGLGVGVWAIIAGVLISVMFSALPIHGIGSLGTTELIWAAAFMALGASKEAAISSGFAVHLLVLLFTAILGVYALISDRYLSTKDKKEVKIEGRS